MSTALAHESPTVDDVRPEALGGESIADLPSHYYRKPRVIISIISLALSYQAAWLAYPMISNVLYTFINEDIGPDPDIIWVNLAYGLTQTVTYVILGRASDLFGRRYFAITGNVLCVIGYLICGRAQSIKTVIGGVTIAGFGYGAQLGCLFIAVPELVPYKWRFTAVGLSMASLSPLSSISTAIARFMATNTEQGWRWIFYFVTILSGSAAILQLFFYFPPNFDLLHQRRTKRETFKNFDFIGLLIFLASATPILLGLSWGGQKYQRFGAGEEPLVPFYLFTRLNYVALMVCCTVASLTFWSLSLIWPMQIQFLFEASPEEVGWKSSTIAGGASCGQILAALLVKRIGHTRWQLVTVAVVFTSFIGGMAGVTPRSEGTALAFSLISSICIGYTEVLTLVAAPLTADDHDIGVASGFEMFFRSLYVTVYSNRISHNLISYVGAVASTLGLDASAITKVITAVSAGTPAALNSIPGMTPQIYQSLMKAASTAYQKSFATVYLMSLAFGGCTIIAALLTRNIDGKLTSHVARRIQVESETEPTDEKAHGLAVEEDRVEAIEMT
ncbi:hypothetical protein H2204_010275 [Knufia peltigerae]|uniref:Major facilitator superfamily (MFS) profile domain-containing protein n=1 Tax=Knufia peltigerae TaxID=1002370 RepID=A0AA38XWJ0_9EURO|nr:hypothetical protein H2204_010275 [Knufia peltigerae]